MILEVAILDVIPNQEKDFESAFAEASSIISSMPGYISHQLQRCIEKQNRYIFWSIGKSWKIIPLAFAVRSNIRSGENFCITFTIRSRRLSIMS